MVTLPERVQFRLSNLHDKDLMIAFRNRLKNEDTDLTKEAKRFIRLGIQYERLQNKHRTVIK